MTDNEIIAEFMGGVRGGINSDVSDLWYFGDRRAKHLQYHTSWDWLMPVVEKIDRLSILGYEMETDIYGKCCVISSNVRPTGKNHIRFFSMGKTKIQAVHESVVEFIKWWERQRGGQE